MGIVFDIQRFCVNDGPGIRTVVFLKGCPLKCLWCHNPESNSIKRQLYCEWNRCAHCGTCAAVCGRRVHEMDHGVHRLRFSDCMLCGACLEICPQGALGIYGRERSAGEVAAEVMKDCDYYEDSGGGVTISGGEPMAQADYVQELCRALKGAGLHVCMETSGFAPWEAYRSLLPDVDLFLFDYKATGEELHRRLTGVGQSLILANLRLLLEAGKNVRLRFPVIPGYNLSEEHLRAIASLSRSGVSAVDMIPYHDMGKGKAKNIGSDLYLSDVRTPEQDEVERWIDGIVRYGGVRIFQA